MFSIKNYKKTLCPNGCELFSDQSKYEYWECKNTTSDELEIVNYLNSISIKNYNLLHIGIGNSYLAKSLSEKFMIDGISISTNEILFAKEQYLSNYKIKFANKLAKNSLNFLKKQNYDFIVDVNLKSFSCCDMAFYKMFSTYVDLLKKNGSILTAKNGLNWSRLLKPVYRFSIKNLFYKRLKEYDGPERNKLSISQCRKLALKNNLKFEEIKTTNIVEFKKK